MTNWKPSEAYKPTIARVIKQWLYNQDKPIEKMSEETWARYSGRHPQPPKE